jgi:esterase/lipase superfamily enzyme
VLLLNTVVEEAASRLWLVVFRSVCALRFFARFHCFLFLLAVVTVCDIPSLVDASQPAEGPAPDLAFQTADSPSPTDVLSSGDDDVWVVSTRRLPNVNFLPTHVSLGVERLVPDAACSRWIPSDLPSLLDDPQRPLVVFIHGNRYDPASAKSQGLLMARRLSKCRPDGPAARTVIFSWPSAQEGILLRDSRAKYERSMTEGHYFAWLLGQIQPVRPVAIVAYSYGGLIALEALDNLARSQRSGRSDLQPWIDRPARLHLVLVAAAVRQDALAPCGEYRKVLPCIDRLTLLNNTRDQALRFFEFIDPDLRTEALGHEHMPARWLPPEIEFIQVDAASIVGKSHRFPPYLDSPSLRQRLAAGALDGLNGD